MATLMLVTNPRTKKGTTKMATRRKPRSAAQKRATAKLVAANRARRAAPARRRRRSVASRVRSGSTATIRRYRRRASTAARRVRRHMRTTTGRASFGIVPLLKQSGVGAVGALAVDIVYGKLPIPDTMKTGYTGAAVKAAATVGLGMLAGRVMNKATAHGATVGALTVQLHALLKDFAAGFGLAGYTSINGVGYYTPAMIAGEGGTPVTSLEYNPAQSVSGVGEYLSEMNYSY